MERACPANTGEAGAIHRVAPFAGQARSHKDHGSLRDSAAQKGWVIFHRVCAGCDSSVEPVGAGLPAKGRNAAPIDEHETLTDWHYPMGRFLLIQA